MSVQKTAPRRRGQNLAGIVLLAAGAVASVTGNAPPANAADDYEIFLAAGPRPA